MDALTRLVKANQFQTLMGLQALVADDSNDPVRRARVALGKLVWKQNQLVRKSVNTDWSDGRLLKLLKDKTLVEIRQQVPEKEKLDSEIEKPETISEKKDLINYLRKLHKTELQLRNLVLKNLAEIPVAIVATAADERAGTMESMDAADFEDPSSIEWLSTGHDLLGKLIFRPAKLQSTTDMTPCYWYRIREFSKSIKSSDEEIGAAEESESMVVERRMRFRALWTPQEGEEVTEDSLILTEAQVHAGLKAAELEKSQEPGKSSGNPFAGVSGERVTLVPVDDDKEGTAEINGRVVGHDSIVDEDYDELEYRILVLPDPGLSGPAKAFWATLDVRADTATLMCQPLDDSSVWYSIEQFDYHVGSPAYRECQSIITWLRRQAKAQPFLEPVDPVALNVPSYFDVIKNPMDISTMQEKLENGQYSSIPPGQTMGQTPVARMLNGSFRKDVELIFDNAMLFNPPDDWIHQAAAHLKKNALKKIHEASQQADQKLTSSGRRQKKSVYVDEDSDVDLYEYESDKDDDFEAGASRRSRKRKRPGRGSANKDDFSSRAIEHPVRLQNTLRDTLGLRGPFANLPVNSDASTFALSPAWSCRKASGLIGKQSDTSAHQMRAKEISDLVALHKEIEKNESAGLRRSTRAHNEPDNSSKETRCQKDSVEYFVVGGGKIAESLSALPSSRAEVETEIERLHEIYYAKLYQKYLSLVSSSAANEGPELFGHYVNGSFPPFLGRIVPVSGSSEVSWEVRSTFIIPALRWVIRGLISSGHLVAIEPLTADSTFSSGVIMTNDIYLFDSKLQPFEVLDLKELQRRRRATNTGDDESEEDIELSEYEKLRAERVARNAERLKALGLA